MKTSNKLLLIAFGIILTGIIVILFSIKKYVVFENINVSGIKTEKIHAVSAFTNLEISGAIYVELQKSTKNELTLVGDTAILSRLTIDQVGDNLILKLKGSISEKHQINAVLRTDKMEINKIRVSAGSSLTSQDTIFSQNIDIDASAGARSNTPVVVKSVDCNASAGATIKLKGEAENLSAQASAGAHVDAQNLAASNVKVNASAGGFSLVWAVETLDVSCSAGGFVKYKGHPDMRNIDLNSGGNLSKID
ncbi:MAG: DUF2807 domain-containing protein [Bacteroidales bacterium]|nr:DUF2807 domain-containing protein [Bacteroidales bacterium]MBN2818801.1 DUF2807 domain-containing protein [Bacteroidales bacterium]